MPEHLSQHPYSRVARIFHNRASVIAVLGLSVALTVGGALISYHYAMTAAEERFELKVDELRQRILDRFLSYEMVLRGARPLFDVDEGKSPLVSFRAYYHSLSIQANLPGIQGVGYSEAVRHKSRSEFEQRIQSEGFAEFQIKPAGDRPTYGPVTYLLPDDWRNQRAYGYDMWSNPLRRVAMLGARNTGAAKITNKITLVQESETNVQPGFLMYVPVYRRGATIETLTDRNAEHIGWVYSPFRAVDFMNGILEEAELQYEMEVYSGDTLNEDSLLFDSDGELQGGRNTLDAQFQKTVEIDLYGVKWSLLVHSSDAGLSGTSVTVPIVIAILGLLVNFILYVVISSIYFLNQRSQHLVEKLKLNAEELNRANADLNQFAFIASHDLQEPLRTVRNYLELLREESASKLDAAANGYIAKTLAASARMSALINAILDYSRVGQSELKTEPIDLNVLMKDLELNLSVLLADTGTLIEYDHLPSVIGRYDDFARLFTNLITNAVKYSQEDVAPIIKIQWQYDARYVRFKVIDNGIGIDEAYFEKVFEIFKRLHSRHEYSGTGIGLAMCRRIVELYGGTISVKANPIRGSIFEFTLLNDMKSVRKK